MANYYRSVKRFLETTYPDYEWTITGANYPPSDRAYLFHTICSYIWYAGLIVMLAGDIIMSTLGIKPPQFYEEYIKNNKTGFFFLLFIINTFGANQLSTGAFEIYFNGDLVYSKLNTGVMPRESELFRIFPRN